MEIAKFTFTKSERLCSNKAISRLFQDGKSGFIYPFRFVYLCEEQGAEQRGEQRGEQGGKVNTELDASLDTGLGTKQGDLKLLISVSKRYHKRANKRNLNKRRIREAYRLNNHELKGLTLASGKKISLALIYSSKESLDYKIIENATIKILSILSKKLF